MTDPMYMLDEEILVFRARQFGARIYHAAGFPEFAKRVELGFEDQSNPVRLGKFFLEPPPSHDEEYFAAWDCAVTMPT
jgi:hypothetical protein